MPGMSHLDTRKNLFTVHVTEHWNSLPREAGVIPEPSEHNPVSCAPCLSRLAQMPVFPPSLTDPGKAGEYPCKADLEVNLGT